MAQSSRPDLEISRAVDEVVRAVAADKVLLEHDLCANFALVDRLFRPRFDLLAASRKILAGAWPDSQAQRVRFVEAFSDYLVASYGDAVVHFDEDTLSLDLLQSDLDPTVGIFFQSGEIRLRIEGESEVVPIQLDHRRGDGGWRIIDVRAEFYSYAKGYQDEFRSLIHESGFDGLLAHLEEKAAPYRQCGL